MFVQMNNFGQYWGNQAQQDEIGQEFNVQSTISFGCESDCELRPINRADRMGIKKTMQNRQRQRQKMTLMEIFDNYLSQPFLDYRLNCSDITSNTTEDAFIQEKNIESLNKNDQQNTNYHQLPFYKLPTENDNHKKKLIKFSQVVNQIQTTKKNNVNLQKGIKSQKQVNEVSGNQKQNWIKIQDRQNIKENIHPNIIQSQQSTQYLNIKQQPQTHIIADQDCPQLAMKENDSSDQKRKKQLKLKLKKPALPSPSSMGKKLTTIHSPQKTKNSINQIQQEQRIINHQQNKLKSAIRYKITQESKQDGDGNVVGNNQVINKQQEIVETGKLVKGLQFSKKTKKKLTPKHKLITIDNNNKQNHNSNQERYSKNQVQQQQHLSINQHLAQQDLEKHQGLQELRIQSAIKTHPINFQTILQIQTRKLR